jgi:hypothetical protein
MQYAAPVTNALVKRGLFKDRPFVLADVGASGVIAQHWRLFEPHFRAYGFDPLVREVERLNAQEPNESVTYHDCFVGFEGYEGLFAAAVQRDPRTGWSNQPFERTSAARAQRLQKTSMAQWFNNEDPNLVYSARRVSLDAFFGARPDVKLDFIKVDTDGHDYEVLCGSTRVLQEHQVLGLFVETQFHGVTHLHSNLFANVDRLLREHGFSLFDLETYRYTREVLPGHFQYSIPAQTREGQLLAGDALYLRDLGAPGYEERWGVRLSREKLLKLACLFEIYGLPDCAAELLLAKKGEFGGELDSGELLSLLARQIHPWAGTLDEVNRQFDTSLAKFYPQSLKERLRRRLPRPLRRLLSRLRWRLRS